MKYSISIFLLLLLLGSCSQPKGDAVDDSGEQEDTLVAQSGMLDSVLARGRLVALTDNSATSYFIYKGRPMGYEYELLHLFADYLNVDLEIKVIQNIDFILDSLNAGVGDIAAANLTITRDRKKNVEFSLPHIKTRQVLVQRLPENRHALTRDQIEKSLVRDLLDLGGKKVYVPWNTSFHERLKNLQNELGDSIRIARLPGNIHTDSVMALVSKGRIDYSIADENVARFYRAFYPEVDINTPVSFSQKIAWALPKGADALRDTLNYWMNEKESKSNYAYIYNKYFKWAKTSGNRVKSDFNLSKGGRISPYDEVIKKYADKMNWPWLLLASVIYEESNFDPNAVSWTGATGLMQVLPETASKYGVDTVALAEPEHNIMAGTSYLEWLYGFWLDELNQDSTEAIPFTLASYNAGLGHVKDARRLAEKYEKDPFKWEANVAEMILRKSKPEYYQDEVVKHGYCRGSEPYNYVKDINAIYEHYRNFSK